jgi:hypothetical protein
VVAMDTEIKTAKTRILGTIQKMVECRHSLHDSKVKLKAYLERQARLAKAAERSINYKLKTVK